MTAGGILLAQGWDWRRVSGSAVVHLVPPQPGRLSRTACSRLSVYDTAIEVPSVLLGELRRCLACVAYASRGGRQ